MDKPFDITQKPLSLVELEQKREALTTEIVAGERQMRLTIWTIAALVLLLYVGTGAGNAHWGWLARPQFAFIVIFTVMPVVMAAGCASLIISGTQIVKIAQTKAALAALSDVDREACLEIKDWLEDDDIRQYRDWVQAEGRVFTLGEVEAMRSHWKSRAKRQEEGERAAAIDAACREVYVDNLIQS
jgi:hypothetical protein